MRFVKSWIGRRVPELVGRRSADGQSMPPTRAGKAADRDPDRPGCCGVVAPTYDAGVSHQDVTHLAGVTISAAPMSLDELVSIAHGARYPSPMRRWRGSLPVVGWWMRRWVVTRSCMA